MTLLLPLPLHDFSPCPPPPVLVNIIQELPLINKLRDMRVKKPQFTALVSSYKVVKLGMGGTYKPSIKTRNLLTSPKKKLKT
jgi:hypothetical protein